MPSSRATGSRSPSCLLALLGAVFLKGFTEAIGVAVALVATYLALNVVVIGVAAWQVVQHPHVVADWTSALTTQHGDPLMMVAIALMVFPSLALGMSGFETGVAVMPHVEGSPRTRWIIRGPGSPAPSGCSRPPR